MAVVLVLAGVGCGGKQASTGYYYFSAEHTINSMPNGGGPTKAFFSDPVHYLGAPIAFDDSNVYFSYSDPVNNPDGGPVTSVVYSVHAAPIVGGPQRTLETGLSWVSTIAVDGSNVYYLVAPARAASADSSDLWSIHRFNLSDGSLSVLTEARGAAGLAAFGGYAYWSQNSAASPSSVLRIPATAGPVETLALGGAPGALAVSARGVFWIDTEQPTLPIACSFAGGPTIMELQMGAQSPTVLASNLVSATSLTVWDNDVYWTAAGIECNQQVGQGMGGVFKSVSSTDGNEVLASGLTAPGQIWVDATSVYVASVVAETSDSPVIGATAVPR